MSEVKRYNHVFRGMIERPKGQFVLAADYIALKEQFDFKQNLTEQVVVLQKQCDAMAAENAAMSRYFSASAGAVDNWNSWADTEDKLSCAPEIPATDAYLNSVRADVIKQLHSEQKEWALHTWQYDNFDALKRAAVRHGDSELSGVIFMLDRIEGFAAQLRAGKDGE